MNVSLGMALLLIIGSLVLGALAVLIDRMNFPQRPFRARAVPMQNGKEPPRDRTGAHIVDDVDWADSEMADNQRSA